jgi:ABC-type multidrug transport system fused ATPase/permease subunit
MGTILAVLATSAATLGTVPLARRAAETFSHLTMPGLNALIAALLGVYLAKSVATWLANRTAARLALLTCADLRAALYEHLQAQGMDFFEHRQAGDLASRLVADVNALRDALVVASGELAPSVLIVAVAVGYLFVLNWRLAALSILGMPLVGFAIGRFSDRLRAWSNAAQGHVGDMLAYLTERLGQVGLVKSFGREAHESERFAAFNRDHLAASLHGAEIQALQTPVVGALQIAAIGLVLWLGGWEILHHRLAVADLLAFAAAVGVCIDPILVLSNATGKIQAASGALDRLETLFAAEPTVREPDRPVWPAAARGDVRCEAMTFAYPGQAPVLRDMDLYLEAGSVVALVGPSGGGKSTVAKLLQRFYDPKEGRITFDGVDLRDLPLGWLRAQIGYVSQDSSVFAGTVTENIRYGRLDASDEEVETAARAAHAHAFIAAWPEGYRTRVGERGATLSGGQRQRLAIARALLRDPKLLILDEATSALDVESEGLVQEAMERLMKGRTTLVIAHRLATVRRADRIITLQDGRVVESGNHQELLAVGGVYAQWVERQSGSR